MELPSRMKLRIDSELPTFAKDSTENEEPSRATPYTAIEAPSREKVRSDIEDPRCVQSKIDKDEPSRIMP